MVLNNKIMKLKIKLNKFLKKLEEKKKIKKIKTQMIEDVNYALETKGIYDETISCYESISPYIEVANIYLKKGYDVIKKDRNIIIKIKES